MSDFTGYQLSHKWSGLSVDNSDYHGWCVKEGVFGSVVASGLASKNEGEACIKCYEKSLSEIK